MSNIKKVQTEADRLLKKVNEGLEAYDELHEKLGNAPNASAKERLEGDLKRELKKLQRHREAMKTFMQNDDYKEKTKMQQSRKRIEERMESFRAIEREMKTKAFSNEGLASAALEKAESPTEQWLKEVIEDGRKKIELLEYEAQKANNGRVRRGKTQQKSDYQLRLEKLQVHFFKWEALLRMVTNEEVDTDEVDELQEPIQKVLEDDADMDVIENMSIYDTFDIAEPKVKATVPFDPSDNDKATSSKSTTKAKTPLSTVQTKASPSITSPKDSATASAKPVPAVAPAVVPNPAATTPASPPTPAVVAAAAAPATTFASPSSVRPPSSSALEREAALGPDGEEETVPEWMDDDIDAANDDTFGDEAMSGAGAGMTVGSLAEMASATSKVTKDWEKPKPASPGEQKAAEEKTKTPTPNAWEQRAAEQQARQKAIQQQEQQLRQQQQQQVSEAASPASSATPKAMPTMPMAPAATAVAAASPVMPAPPMSTPLAASPLLPTNIQASSPPASSTSPVAAAAGAGAVPAVFIPASQSESTSPIPPLTTTAGSAPGSPQPRYTAKRINEMLDMSLGNLPHTLDVQRQRTYEPPNAIDPIPYFPQEVLPVLSNKNVYHQMDLDTLFFIFYYHQKSYQQYFAAKELKARSYRYHTKQQRWYQRLERPQSTTETEERGAYTFFDFEDKWDHDRTDDFLFEYKYLENELN
jgi:CCR4-NOT transcription complex subunit 3